MHTQLWQIKKIESLFALSKRERETERKNDNFRINVIQSIIKYHEIFSSIHTTADIDIFFLFSKIKLEPII